MCVAPPDSLKQLSGKITITPGSEYDAGSVHRILFGDHWRDLWTTPIRVDMLNLNHYAGGLTPYDKGGGEQTISLKLKDKAGHEYRFRSMNKDVTKVFPEELQKSFAQVVLQDQISAANPAAPLIAYKLINAVGILQAQPILFVLSGEGLPEKYKDDFTGMAGMLEVHPDENEKTGTAFAGADKISGTYKLFKKLEDDNDNRINAPEYLKARLMDIFINDWDRHVDQWRWAAFKENNFTTWYPVPKDRDQAFTKFDGFFPRLATIFVKKLVSFSEKYGSIESLTFSGRYTDRRLLSSLDKAEWDSVTYFVTGRLTDSIIISAVKEMPPEMYARGGEELIQDLISRRDKLKEASDEFYEIVSEYVNIYGSDKHEYAEVTRLDDEQTEVSIYKKDGDKGKIEKQLFHRIFNTEETKEVRLILLGGDDSVLVKGNVNDGIKIIVSGGKGENTLIDSSNVKGNFLWLFSYDKDETDFFVSNKKTGVVKSNGTTVYEERYGDAMNDTVKFEPLFNNYGHDWNWLPWVTINSDEGLLFGAGRNLFKYGYDRKPFIYKLEYWMAYATKTRRVRAELTARHYPHAGIPAYNFSFYATGDEVLNYYGRGNNTYPDNSKIKEEYYDIDQQQFIITPSVDLPVTEASRISIGTTFKYVQTEKKQNTYVTDENPFGIEDIVLHSVFVSYTADTRNGLIAPTSGYYYNLRSTFFPGYFKNNTMFGKISLSGRYYYEFNYPFFSSLAFRGGVEKIWGTFPFFESSFIGGQGSLRGVEKNRFAGDASIYTGAELRSYPFDFYLVVPVKAGFTLFAETGRVFIDNQYSGMWHNTFGGGLLISLLKRDFTFSFSAAVSREDVEYYLITGFAF